MIAPRMVLSPGLLISKRRDSMIRSQLRLYHGPDADTNTTVLTSPHEKSQQVTVNAGEVFAGLADAIQSGRAWLRDFEDDKVTLSSDLYEVIMAYQNFRRPSA